MSQTEVVFDLLGYLEDTHKAVIVLCLLCISAF